MAAAVAEEGGADLKEAIRKYFRNDNGGALLQALDEADEEHVFNVVSGLTNEGGRTCFQKAVALGQKNLIQRLFALVSEEDRLALLKKEDSTGNTTIFLSASRDTPEIFEQLVNGLSKEQITDLLQNCCARGFKSLTEKAARRDHGNTLLSLVQSVSSDVLMDTLTAENEDEQILLHSMRPGITAKLLENLPPEQVEELLEVRGNNNNTILHEDSFRSDAAVISALNNWDPSKRLEILQKTNNDGETPLHIAGAGGIASACSSILNNLSREQCQQLLTRKDHNGNMPLHLAALGNHHPTITKLLEPLDGDEQQLLQLLEKKDGKNNNAIHIASLNGHTESLKEMLQFMKMEHRFRLLKPAPETGTPIVKAVRNNHGAAAKAMLQSLVADSGDPSLCIQLLKSNLSEDDSVTHAILAYNASLPMFKYLNSAVGASQITDLLALRNQSNQTPVHYAALNNSNRSLEEAMMGLSSSQQFAITTLTDNEQKSPIHYAAEKKNLDVLKVLLNDLLPANKLNVIDAKDRSGRTPESSINEPGEVVDFLQQCREDASRRRLESVGLEDQVRGLQAMVDNLAETQLTLVQVRSLSKQVETLEHENRDLKEQAGVIEGKIENLESQLKQNGENLTVEQRKNIEHKINTLRMSNTELKSKIKNNEAIINSLIPQIARLDADLANRYRGTGTLAQDSESNRNKENKLKQLLKAYVDNQEDSCLDLAQLKEYLKPIPIDRRNVLLNEARGATANTIWHRVAADQADILSSLFDSLKDSNGCLQDSLWKTFERQDQNGKTPIAIAVCNNNIPFLQTVKKRSLSTWWLKVLQMHDNSCCTVMHDAVSLNNSEALELILDSLQGTNDGCRDLLKQKNEEKETPIHLAVPERRIDAVCLAVNSVTVEEWKEILVERDKNGLTAQNSAINRADNEMLDLMLSHLNPQHRLEILISEGTLDGTLLFHQLLPESDQNAGVILTSLASSKQYESIQANDQLVETTVRKLLESLSESDTGKLTKKVDALTPDNWCRIILVKNANGKTAIECAVLHNLDSLKKMLTAKQKRKRPSSVPSQTSKTQSKTESADNEAKSDTGAGCSISKDGASSSPQIPGEDREEPENPNCSTICTLL